MYVINGYLGAISSSRDNVNDCQTDVVSSTYMSINDCPKHKGNVTLNYQFVSVVPVEQCP